MKKNLMFVSFAFVFLGCIVVSCEWFDNLVSFSFTTGYEEISFSVDPSAAGEYIFVETLMQSDIEAEIEENGGSIKNLNDITVEEAVLLMVTPGQNLDPFEWIEVYVSTPDQAEILIGSVYEIGNGLLSVNLGLSDESLKEILKHEEYKVKVIGSLGEDITLTLDLLVKIKYKVKVGA